VPVGTNPYYGVAVNPAGTRVYVTNQVSNTVSVINTSTNTVVATVNVGKYPCGVAVNPAGTRVYVVNEFDKNVSVIDTATNTVTASVNVGLNPYSFGQFIVTPIATPLVPINITSHGNNVTNNNSLTITVNQSTNVRFNVTTDISIFANITSISEGVISLGNDTLGKVTFWADFLFPKYGTQWVNLSFKNTTGSSLSDYRNWTVNVLDNIAPNQVTNLTNATISVHNAIHLTWDVGTDNSGGSGIKDYFIDVMNNSINWLTIPRPTINASNISSGYTKDAYWYTLRNTVPVNCSGCHSTLGTKEYAIGNFWMKFNSTHLFIMAHLPDNDINTSDDYVGFGFDPLRNGGTYPQTDDRWYELYENGSLATFTGNGTAWISNTTNALRSVKGAGNGTNLTYGAPRYEIAIPLSELGNPTNGSAVNFILEIECQDGWDFQKRSSFFPVAGVYDNPSTWTTLTYRNSTQWDTIGTSTTNSYEATQLLSNFRYNFSVRARDNVSNIGNRSINYTGQTADRNGYNISGYITSGGSPVIGAHIKTGEYIVDSDSNGFYILTDLANYTYTLIATASRHGSNSTNVTLNGSDIPNVNMSLEYIPPSLYDSRDTSPPSEDVSLTGYGWDSYETIRIKINKSGTTLNTSYITADANGAFINKYINLGTGYATGIYNIYVSTNGGSTYVLYDTFSVTGVTWYRPSYQNETLGAVGDIITVTASSN
jgi:YVTN family beta-propeller protein